MKSSLITFFKILGAAFLFVCLSAVVVGFFILLGAKLYGN